MKFNVIDMLATRGPSPGFHVASEQNLRIEVRNLNAGERVEAFRYAGNVLLICFGGRFHVTTGGDTETLTEHDQLLVSENSWTQIGCETKGTLQLVWSPPFAATETA